jgi:iron complex transport system ATP-binding protein
MLGYAPAMSSETAPILVCNKLRVTVPGRVLVDDLDFSLRPGELIAVLGQNGAGKSMALLTLAGLRAADKGQVLLKDEDVVQAPRQWTARHLALLPQVVDDIFPATVLDTVLIGRHPHIGRLQWESAEDHRIAMRALKSMGLDDLSDRNIFTLSGGERRRLAIAQVLTQAPSVYLLDEPSNHLDPQHQLDALQLFRGAANDGAGVITALHDVNLAARFADKCLLLFGDGRWEFGECKDVLTAATLSELFATRMESVSWRSHELFVAASDHESL